MERADTLFQADGIWRRDARGRFAFTPDEPLPAVREELDDPSEVATNG